MRQRLGRESRTLLADWGSGGPTARCGSWSGLRRREDLVDGSREDLDRYHKGERAALGKAHADSTG